MANKKGCKQRNQKSCFWHKDCNSGCHEGEFLLVFLQKKSMISFRYHYYSSPGFLLLKDS